jgi:hypothetical protein
MLFDRRAVERLDHRRQHVEGAPPSLIGGPPASSSRRRGNT